VPAVLPDAAAWPAILLAAGTCTIAYFFLYASLSLGDVSSVMPMMGSKVIFSGFLAHFMLGESHTTAIYLAALLVAISIAALSYSPRHAQGPSHAGLAAVLMLACCLIFGLTDIFIKRALAHVDASNFLVYYNALVAVGTLPVLALLRYRKQPLGVTRGDLGLLFLAAGFLMAATLLFVKSFNLADNVVVPNILVSTRGVFIVLLTAAASAHSSTRLDAQSRWIFLLRLAASSLLIFAIWLALR
jgi:drug/metabolite transporter (DMT)-like permease